MADSAELGLNPTLDVVLGVHYHLITMSRASLYVDHMYVALHMTDTDGKDVANTAYLIDLRES